MEKKMITPSDLLCRGFPNEFGIFLNYTRTMRFDDKPDYSHLCKLSRDLFVREGFQYRQDVRAHHLHFGGSRLCQRGVGQRRQLTYTIRSCPSC